MSVRLSPAATGTEAVEAVCAFSIGTLLTRRVPTTCLANA